jgi:hypothetical protein
MSGAARLSQRNGEIDELWTLRRRGNEIVEEAYASTTSGRSARLHRGRS